MSGPLSIVEALLQRAERAPEAPCLFFEGQAFPYGALASQASRWAGQLRSLGVERGERVALFHDNAPAFALAYFGAQLAGAIPVLVNTQYKLLELRHILSDSGALACVCDRARLGELARAAAEVGSLKVVALTEAAPDAELDAFQAASRRLRPIPLEQIADVEAASLPAPEDGALIAYTSGTTGRSKGALLSHGNLAANARAVADAWRWTAEDRLLLTLPLFHVHGLCVGLQGTIFAGASAELWRSFDARAVLARLGRAGVSLFFGVPTMYARLLEEARQSEGPPPQLRLFVSGSAPLSERTFADFEQRFGQRILERYGMTETLMSLTNPYQGERRAGTVGGPFPGQEARVVDLRTRAVLPDGAAGEIQVRGPHVFRGYWRNPTASELAFDRDGWFNTGDLGHRSVDGYYAVSGRARELIITGGYNVYPREVEEVLLSHPGVAEAAVLGLPDKDLGEQVVAAVVPREGQAATAEELIAHCKDSLASFKKPRRVFFLKALPLNALGKIQKHLLREELVRSES
jgi:malonyl-CoA/methylmalonyl-CoA synthetase